MRIRVDDYQERLKIKKQKRKKIKLFIEISWKKIVPLFKTTERAYKISFFLFYFHNIEHSNKRLTINLWYKSTLLCTYYKKNCEKISTLVVDVETKRLLPLTSLSYHFNNFNCSRFPLCPSFRFMPTLVIL